MHAPPLSRCRFTKVDSMSTYLRDLGHYEERFVAGGFYPRGAASVLQESPRACSAVFASAVWSPFGTRTYGHLSWPARPIDTTMSDWNADVTITPPPSGEVIDAKSLE